MASFLGFREDIHKIHIEYADTRYKNKKTRNSILILFDKCVSALQYCVMSGMNVVIFMSVLSVVSVMSVMSVMSVIIGVSVMNVVSIIGFMSVMIVVEG